MRQQQSPYEIYGEVCARKSQQRGFAWLGWPWAGVAEVFGGEEMPGQPFPGIGAGFSCRDQDGRLTTLT